MKPSTVGNSALLLPGVQKAMLSPSGVCACWMRGSWVTLSYDISEGSEKRQGMEGERPTLPSLVEGLQPSAAEQDQAANRRCGGGGQTGRKPSSPLTPRLDLTQTAGRLESDWGEGGWHED